MTSNIIDSASGVATTTGLQTITVTDYTVMDDSAALVQVEITGQNLTTGATCGAIITSVIKKIGSGDVEIVGSVLNILPITGDLALITAAVTIDVSGDKIRARATGVLLENIEWYANLHIQLRSQN